MKDIKLSLEIYVAGDEWEMPYFDFSEAVAAAKVNYDRLTDAEKARTEAYYVDEYDVKILSKNYTITTAKALYDDITSGNVEVEGFDKATGQFADSAKTSRYVVNCKTTT